jgi:type I restriction enzyme R subunit
VKRLFQHELGYRFLGDWSDRANNSNIEESLLRPWLRARGHTDAQISAAVRRLKTEADNPHRSLYENNRAVYGLLRYGIGVQTEAGKRTETVHLIDWQQPEANDFALAEEVTLCGGHERRPDLVLYLNGIAIGVLELKRSSVSIGDGIRQNLSNQQPAFNAPFFSTVQWVLAGNDSEGLRYGTVGTEEKYFLKWKEDEADDTRYKLDKYLLKLFDKARCIELMRDFVLFDGQKKLPRHHQYFAIKEAQKYVEARKGGIIWHTQGSGKSIVMVLLARWILAHNPRARVVVITDRDELDKQIERVFSEAGETIYRTGSGRDLMAQLGQARPRLLCSLIHKFGVRGVDDFEQFIRDLQAQPAPAVGDLFVFVDECHRTESGKLHRAMKAILKDAVFIGFTGTPLLKKDRQTTLEVFGSYIHTYKFNEAVADEVVLDLVYEARDIDQRISSPERIDAWFEAKTATLNDWQKDELKKQWGTMQKVLSSRSRMDQVVNDILFDFSVSQVGKPRLSSGRGNAMLVASSIYEACKYFTLLQQTPFRGKCALVTSYNPQTRDITLEETGANSETDKQFIYNTYTELLRDEPAQAGMSRTESYEERVKKLFLKNPAEMKLLVVVDKLLTGFDAPACTYLYIDKSMQDHGLFQAICRTNRLDGADKDFGYIVDYKDLFKKLENAFSVYTSELDDSAGGEDPDVLLKERLAVGRERLEKTLEALAILCEPVQPPKDTLDYLHYFCGNTEIPEDLAAHAPQRTALYKAVASLVRAYVNVADEMGGAGYSAGDRARIKRQVDEYVRLRTVIRNASGESIDLKAYESDMRFLIDNYIKADEPRKISPFDGMPLLELIAKAGIDAAIAGALGEIQNDSQAVAETIENNVRSKIIRDQRTDPAYYARMSQLLDEIIAARKAKALEYEDYLRRIAEVARQVNAGHADDTPEPLKRSAGLRAIYNHLERMPAPAREDRADYKTNREEILALARKIDEGIRQVKPDDWRGVQSRENVIRGKLADLLGDDDAVEPLFDIIKQQNEY